ncbi:cGMP-specific 3',5'-cyclic phosphodiesterase [Melia azedarach]|uniref:cGMP-specific 3',5'-cyclic phosphodiesterase n=1 Tax=Melia azedarach TaxID=155640 RepID=A0ACC1XTP7_MELAZ|nr:cGMP-specific 3',5'-cyclic phosphodiesterase [Melia azedarach]
MFGIDGIEVGNGGSVTFGAVGRDGIWVLGKGGRVGFGRVGNDGIEGNGGNVTLGSGGIVGSGAAGACRSWRAAVLISKLENDNATSIDNTKQCLKEAIFFAKK